MDGKTKAIVAHLTIVGWLIAFILNNTEKDEYASFYIRQQLGLMLTGIALGILSVFPIIGWLVSAFGGIALFIFWLVSLIWAIQGETKPLPWIGQYFQDWFKAL